MSPFRNIFRLVVGDTLAKALSFVAFVYLARTLGVKAYGTLELAVSLLTWMLLLADGGLELWATREAARGADVRALAARIVPLRLLLAGVTFGLLMLLLPVLPDYPGLRTMLVLFGLTLFVQAFTLKSVFTGKERLAWVGFGLLLAQLSFAGVVFLAIRRPEQVVWVPIARIAGDLTMAVWFLVLFVRTQGGLPRPITLRGARSALVPALTLGATSALGLLSYNFDAILIGFLVGPAALGLYGAAYKPVTVGLAIPITYFLGLFPVLSRTWTEDRDAFRETVLRSLRLTATLALPIGLGASFLADPVLRALYGAEFAGGAIALRILGWSAVLVILRGTFRQSLMATGNQRADLVCAGIATALNVVGNCVLIPLYGIVGAAAATVTADVLWLGLAVTLFRRRVLPVNPLRPLARPLVAAAAMAGAFVASGSLHWLLRAGLATLSYFAVVFVLTKAKGLHR